MSGLDLLQWPATVASLLASWLVASQSAAHRNHGFWLFLFSNVLWIAWALHSGSWALVVLQVGLASMNIRGAYKNAA
ncbi:MAG: hypothetical protein QE285_06605 [Aquabacterium sp.]|nr:hypothetical protein [Aquabacterium sp.]